MLVLVVITLDILAVFYWYSLSGVLGGPNSPMLELVYNCFPSFRVCQVYRFWMGTLHSIALHKWQGHHIYKVKCFLDLSKFHTGIFYYINMRIKQKGKILEIFKQNLINIICKVFMTKLNYFWYIWHVSIILNDILSYNNFNFLLLQGCAVWRVDLGQIREQFPSRATVKPFHLEIGAVYFIREILDIYNVCLSDLPKKYGAVHCLTAKMNNFILKLKQKSPL